MGLVCDIGSTEFLVHLGVQVSQFAWTFLKALPSFLESRQNVTKCVNYFAEEYVCFMILRTFFLLCCVHIFTSEYCYFHRWVFQY
jgi:hypothetical protein